MLPLYIPILQQPVQAFNVSVQQKNMPPLDLSVQQQSLLSLDESVLKQTLLPVFVNSIAACAALLFSSLTASAFLCFSAAQQTVLPLDVYGQCCLWMDLF